MTKFLITGDWHLDHKAPKNRIDDYVATQIGKMKWIFEFALGFDDIVILQPGDFFNSHKMPDHIKTFWINFFIEYNVPILTVPGQHDMRYHSSNLDDTPMGVLEAAGVIQVLEGRPVLYPHEDPCVSIYGAGWNQDIPKMNELVTGISVLVIHKMVSLIDLPYEYTDVIKLLKTNSFNLIVTGDNHKSIYKTYQDRVLINCGSLMRSSIDQVYHEPIIYIYDTKTRDIERHLIPIKPFEKVMNLEKVKKEKERNEELEAFVDGLSDANIEGLDFKKNLISYLDDNKETIGDGVIRIINRILGDQE